VAPAGTGDSRSLSFQAVVSVAPVAVNRLQQWLSFQWLQWWLLFDRLRWLLLIDSSQWLSFAAPMAIVRLTPVALSFDDGLRWLSLQWLQFCQTTPAVAVVPVAPVAVVPVAPMAVVRSTPVAVVRLTPVAVVPVAPELTIDFSSCSSN